MLKKIIIDANGILINENLIVFAKNSDNDYFGLKNINLDFERINLIVGESRAFKSTLLNMISNHKNKIPQQVYYFSQNDNQLQQLKKLFNDIDINAPKCMESSIIDFEDFLKANLDIQSVSLNPIHYNIPLTTQNGKSVKLPHAEEHEKINYNIEIEHNYYNFKVGIAMMPEDKGVMESTEKEPLLNASSGAAKIGLLHALIKYGIITIDSNSIILIDELENSLSPVMLKNVIKLLVNLAKEGVQLFITSHSPDVIEEFVINDRLFASTAIFRMQNDKGLSKVEKLTNIQSSNYPTAAELKWTVFNKATTDYHDQLWGELSYDSATRTVKNVYELDKELEIAAYNDKKKLKKWKGYRKDDSNPAGRRSDQSKDTVTLPAYIRNYVHHPEFTDINNVKANKAFSYDELRDSIAFLISQI